MTVAFGCYERPGVSTSRVVVVGQKRDRVLYHRANDPSHRLSMLEPEFLDLYLIYLGEAIAS